MRLIQATERAGLNEIQFRLWFIYHGKKRISEESGNQLFIIIHNLYYDMKEYKERILKVSFKEIR